MDEPSKPTGPSFLHRLPLEILYLVCAVLEKPDLGKLRLTCKLCATAGIQSLVKELHLFYTLNSHMNLIKISLFPELRKHVKSIIYEPLLLDDAIDNEGDYLETIQRWGSTDTESETDDDEVQQGWDTISRMLREQQFLGDSCYDLTLLKEAMKQFSVDRFTIRANATDWCQRHEDAYGQTLATPRNGLVSP